MEMDGESDSDELYDLLEKMVDPSTIQEMKTQKINCNRITMMDETLLQRYIPLYGDRIEVMDFAKRKCHSKELGIRKQGVVARLMQKYNQNQGKEKESKQGKRKYTIKKTTRKIELGWLHKNVEFEEYLQVKQTGGGGVRQVDVPKNTTKDGLIQIGKTLFFPDGVSKKGNLSDFTFDLLDFKRDIFNNESTVEDIFTKTQLPRLKFYLGSKRINAVCCTITREASCEENNLDDSHQQSFSMNEYPLHLSPTVSPIVNIETDDVPNPINCDVNYHQFPLHLSPTVATVASSLDNIETDDVLNPINYDVNYQFDGEYDLENISSVFNLPSIPEGAEKINVFINREYCLNEMLELYSNDSIIDKTIFVEFLGETGLDTGGLTKELFTLFWKEAETYYFAGENCIIPFLPLHKRKLLSDFVKMGRIFSHMLLLTNTLPVKLSRVFLLTLVDTKIDDDILVEDFLLYVTEIESNVIKKSLNNFSNMTEKEKELLFNIFQTFNYYDNPKQLEIKEQIKTIAHDTLIEKPQYLLEKFKEGIPQTIQIFFRNCSSESITFLLGTHRPTTNKFLDCLSTSEILNNEETKVLHFLRIYISSLNGEKLLQLLFFITGTYSLPIDTKINVSFNSLAGHLTRPISHTCSNTLELSTFYNTYQEFKKNMNLYLESDYSYQYTQL